MNLFSIFIIYNQLNLVQHIRYQLRMCKCVIVNCTLLHILTRTYLIISFILCILYSSINIYIQIYKQIHLYKYIYINTNSFTDTSIQICKYKYSIIYSKYITLSTRVTGTRTKRRKNEFVFNLYYIQLAILCTTYPLLVTYVQCYTYLHVLT